MANSNKCSMDIKVPEKIKAPENQNDLVWSVVNRKQEYQKIINSDLKGSQFNVSTSFFSKHSWEFGKESDALAVQKLCQNEYIIPSSVTDTRSTNQNSCNENSDTRNDRTLLKLQRDHENSTQELLKILKNKQPYRDETNKNVLNYIEIGLFAGMYGITDFCLVLACEDSVFWLEDHDGAIYFWSRIDDSMIRGGDDLKEALTNYLFNQKNLHYVDEITCKLIPINAYDKEAEEWAKSPEAYVYIDKTKVSLKHESKMGEVKKQQKKKKKKNKKKH